MIIVQHNLSRYVVCLIVLTSLSKVAVNIQHRANIRNDVFYLELGLYLPELSPGEDLYVRAHLLPGPGLTRPQLDIPAQQGTFSGGPILLVG